MAFYYESGYRIHGPLQTNVYKLIGRPACLEGGVFYTLCCVVLEIGTIQDWCQLLVSPLRLYAYETSRIFLRFRLSIQQGGFWVPVELFC